MSGVAENTHEKQSMKKLSGGSCFILGIRGMGVTAEEKALFRTFQPAGVILFKRNISSIPQLIDLINELKSLVKDHPLLVGVDHEGGRVFRLPPPFSHFPVARQWTRLAQDNKKGFVETMARAVAQQIRRVGFNLNFAPVLDVDTEASNPIIGDRSFSKDPPIVASMGAEYIQGLQGAGVMACGKHFPGHGGTKLDSHLDLPVETTSRVLMRKRELIPFQRAIRHRVAMIMPAHVLYTQWDDHTPATLSKKILQTLLRQSLGYKGLVISDDLCMQGIARLGILEDLAVESFAAGIDLPLICQDFESHGRILDRFCREVSRRHGLRRRFLETQRRLASLRRRFRLRSRRIPPLKGPLPGGEVLKHLFEVPKGQIGEGSHHLDSQGPFYTG